MNLYYKYFIILFFVFFVALGAGEALRLQNYQEMIYKEIQIASLDAMAVTADEKLKQDNVLYLENPYETQSILEDLINANLKISILSSKVLATDYYIHDIRITDFRVNQGSYHYEGEIPVQDTCPEIIVKGNFKLVPFMARFDDFYLEANINNRTEYIFAN